VFERFIEYDLEVHVELGMGIKHAVKGYGTVPFRIELGDFFRVQDVLWVP
jgi:hypothetical protein